MKKTEKFLEKSIDFRLVDGIMHGLQKVYDPTGHLWFENTWKNGNLTSYKYVK